MIEKRRHIRLPLRIEARYQDRDGNILKGRVRNVGMGGAYIETETPLGEQTTLNICLDVVDIGRVIDIHGRVVRIVDGEGMAVEFSDKQHKEIRELLDIMRKYHKAAIISVSRVGEDGTLV